MQIRFSVVFQTSVAFCLCVGLYWWLITPLIFTNSCGLLKGCIHFEDARLFPLECKLSFSPCCLCLWLTVLLTPCWVRVKASWKWLSAGWCGGIVPLGLWNIWLPTVGLISGGVWPCCFWHWWIKLFIFEASGAPIYKFTAHTVYAVPTLPYGVQRWAGWLFALRITLN